jgi:hypothetical protein
VGERAARQWCYRPEVLTESIRILLDGGREDLATALAYHYVEQATTVLTDRGLESCPRPAVTPP